MPFDQPTRNRLARFVADARSLLSEEFTRQLQHEYGLDPTSGDVAELAKLGHLDDARRETARILRATLAHYLAGAPKADKKARQETLARIVREQAYTVLNRLAALRMAEARGLLIESVARGYQSRGFQLYAHLAGPALGETGAAYRSFLFSLFDELAVELPALFDRYNPQGRLFPRESALLHLLDLLNAPDLEALWGEDETIGWIYQYFNSGEERRQMRAESQAPRNSRELAVRNQFFTPRYVVEFLTDNTLGRIWYEMTQGRTQLTQTCRYLVRRPNEVFLAEGQEAEGERLTVNGADGEGLSQEELLQQPVYIPYRAPKDPREITMLDPACGSMHFGLYAFDLFERIYEEAWELEAGERLSAGGNRLSDHGSPITDHRSLISNYPSKEALRRAIPRLIIEHNIHGIDIDPRAVQIAGLSLWLRAQRSWQVQGLRPQERPAITRSHIVCAEPMPGEAALLEEFLAGLRADRLEGLIRRVLDVPAGQQVRATARMAGALCDLVRTVWQEMRLAGEAGSLLKIEETLANAVAAAEREWSERMPLFRVVEFSLTGEAERVRYPRGVPGQEGVDFWQQAEALVLAALHDYVEQAQNGAGYQRRLFAADAAHGFDFIDLCRRRYDVIVMNPPFVETLGELQQYFRVSYPNGWTNTYSVFIERSLGLCRGRIGLVCPDGFLSAYRMRYLREKLVTCGYLDLLTVLGTNVFDDMGLSTAALTLESSSATSSPLLMDVSASHVSIVTAISKALVSERTRYILTPDLVNSGSRGWSADSLEPMHAKVIKGNTTFDDFRFTRVWWEVAPADIGLTWQRWQKGGEYQPFFSSTPYVVKWNVSTDGAEIREHGKACVGTDAQVAQSSIYWWRAGLVGPAMNTTGAGFNLRVLPSGQIFSAKSTVIIPQFDDDIYVLLGLINSQVLRWFLFQQGAGLSGNTGKIKSLPIVLPEDEPRQKLEIATKHALVVMQEMESVRDTSPVFVDYMREFRELVSKYKLLAEEIDETVAEIYRTALDAEEVLSLGDLAESAAREATGGCDIESFFQNRLSYLLLLVFGRWDIRYATGEKSQPEPPHPFAPLTACPPGMLQNAEGLPAAFSDIPLDYPLRISWSGILVDDPGHPEDIETRVRDALRVIWPDTGDAIEQEACATLGVASLRDYFAQPNEAFDDHLRRYSRSRRYAPIYWPLSTASGSYTLWLYYHRLSDQTLYWCVNDFVEPRLAVISEQLAVNRRKGNRSRQEEKELERLSDLEAELRELRDELLRVAAFWRPNLNDGVQITAAPLWRLFRHRAWQRRLRETWEQLEAGAYDWAHLALSIWPARVVPKCVTDRSLAIAHDLEELFWIEDPPGSWRTLRAPDEELAGLVAAQQSPARARLAVLLAELARGRARGLRCAEVWDELAAGRWDDLEAALLLWPERVAEACWDDPLLAMTLQIALPTKRTKAARDRFVKERVAAGCPDLAAALEAALRQRPDRFAAFWSELARGDHDHLRLALALWPERVVDKCAADVELAAEHEVRRFLWVRREDVWRRRMGQNREVAVEVTRRQASIL